MESGAIHSGSDKQHSDNQERGWRGRVKRDTSTRYKAKQGKKFCQHCRWSPPVPELLHAHHVIPRGCGGPDTVENMLVLCPNCHAIAHYVTARTNLTRTYTGPRTIDGLREWMWAAKFPNKLRALRQAYVVNNARPILDSLRP